jgi:hypothetical protein
VLFQQEKNVCIFFYFSLVVAFLLRLHFILFFLLVVEYTHKHIQTDVVFLDREIKNRKQAFGIEIYDLMEELENDETLSVAEKESKIRASFDAARKDIAVIAAKKECKKEEMAVLEAEAGVGSGSSGAMYDIPPSDGVVVNNTHPTASTTGV